MFTKPKTKAKKGFTLIELLVVISIIGLLSTLAVVALNNARVRSRDASRMANVQQLQTAMQLYYDTYNTWDFTGTGTTGCGNADSGADSIVYTRCVPGGSLGLGDFMQATVLKDPNGAATTPCPAFGSGAGGSGAPGDRPAAGCQIAFTALPTVNTYQISFCLEGTSTNLAQGGHNLTHAGIR